MGSRWTYYIDCAGCGVENDVWYAPSCGFDTLDFTCKNCRKRNKVQESISVKLDAPFDEPRKPSPPRDRDRPSSRVKLP